MRLMGSVTRIPELRFGSLRALHARSLGRYALEFVIIGSSYLVFAKLGWTLAAAVQPGAPPIWPATGLAWAAVLVRGMRIWPAIFISAWAASAQFGGAGPVLSCAALAAGSTLGALLGGHLTNLWSGGRKTFDTAAGVAKFTLIASGSSTIFGAVMGIGRVGLTDYSDWPAFLVSSTDWWLCDLTGALVVAPAIVLWVNDIRSLIR